jgi:hypothetical protein
LIFLNGGCCSRDSNPTTSQNWKRHKKSILIVGSTPKGIIHWHGGFFFL